MTGLIIIGGSGEERVKSGGEWERNGESGEEWEREGGENGTESHMTYLWLVLPWRP